MISTIMRMAPDLFPKSGLPLVVNTYDVDAVGNVTSMTAPAASPTTPTTAAAN